MITDDRQLSARPTCICTSIHLFIVTTSSVVQVSLYISVDKTSVLRDEDATPQSIGPRAKWQTELKRESLGPQLAYCRSNFLDNQQKYKHILLFVSLILSHHILFSVSQPEQAIHSPIKQNKSIRPIQSTKLSQTCQVDSRTKSQS